MCGRGARSVRTTKGSSSSSAVTDADNCCVVSVARGVSSVWTGSPREEGTEATGAGRDADGDG